MTNRTALNRVAYGTDEILVLLSDTLDRALIAEEIAGKVGDDPKLWIPEFLRTLGIGDAVHA